MERLCRKHGLRRRDYQYDESGAKAGEVVVMTPAQLELELASL
jgi:hypothetical protein